MIAWTLTAPLVGLALMLTLQWVEPRTLIAEPNPATASHRA